MERINFQKLLLRVTQELSKEEVKAVIFLCTDHLKPTTVESAIDLFRCLKEGDHLSPEQPDLLTELLNTIQRSRLVRDLKLNNPSANHSGISSYRKLLYELSVETTDTELKDVKFLLDRVIPRPKLEDYTMLEIFLEMERRDCLSETNVDQLEEILSHVNHALKEKVRLYKERQNLPEDMQFGEEATAAPQSLLDLSTGKSQGVPVQVSTDALGQLQLQGYEVVPSVNPDSEDVETYPMTAAKRGVCLIINNSVFAPGSDLSPREGTMTDESSLSRVFEWLDFDMKIERNCTRAQMLSLLRELGTRDPSQTDCVACCVLSHGQEGSVFGVDGQLVELKELTDSLNGFGCPSLVGKPKLFFIQACQGKKEQGAHVQADGPTSGRDRAPKKDFIPSDADFLKAMSTVPGHVSFRDMKKGTWFIQSLCHNLVRMVPRKIDLMTILTKVNSDVSQKTKRNNNYESKQMPQPSNTLRKNVVFPVPKGPPPELPQW